MLNRVLHGFPAKTFRNSDHLAKYTTSVLWCSELQGLLSPISIFMRKHDPLGKKAPEHKDPSDFAAGEQSLQKGVIIKGTFVTFDVVFLATNSKGPIVSLYILPPDCMKSKRFHALKRRPTTPGRVSFMRRQGTRKGFAI